MSEQMNSVGIVPGILTQCMAYIWNNFSMFHLELVAETSATDTKLPFQFFTLIMSSELSLTLNLLRPWTKQIISSIYIRRGISPRS